ncbi:sensor histidine kinase [Streptococcus henryi]|uniref:sensor histidine kinase n=1 Tax=Streptococcus henryi TaxID=439219 RepID=UPI000372D25C|nr:histidine kinase [Streptococcus henryi]
MSEKEGIIPFKVKLRKEILRGFQKASIFIGFSYFVVLILFIFMVQFRQLVEGRNTIISHFEQMTLQTDQIFKNLEGHGLGDFLSGEIAEREMFRQVYQETGQLPFRSALSIYTKDNQLVLSTKLPNRDGLSDDSYVKIAMKNITNQAEYRISKDYQGNRYLIKIKPLVEGEETIGYLVLYIDGSDFEASVQADSTQYIIADKYQNLFSSNSMKYTSQELKKVDERQFLDILTIRDGKIYLNNHYQLGNHLVLYSYISVVPISYLIIVTGLFVVFIMVILMTLALRLSRRIVIHSSDSVDVLVADLEKIVNGYKAELEVNTDDEFGYLAKKINGMLDTLQRLFYQTLKSEKEKTVFQRKLLEAQFHPHFLYNSLESIKILIRINPEKAEQMILSLNRVLRYSIASDRENVPLERDMAIIEDYLAVNSIRFDLLYFQLDYPEELEQLLVPKLFLLPLIENSLKYGMEFRHDLMLRVQVTCDEHQISFSVSDNGPGFSQDFKEHFSEYVKDGQTEHGLVNSYSRLSMLYPSSKIRLWQEEGLQGVELTFERRQACYE